MINSKTQLLLAGLTLSLAAASSHAALLVNGDFNTAAGTGPVGWSNWSYGNGWANYQTSPATDTFDFDDTPYVNVGAFWNGGGGWYQDLPATAGYTYSLSVYSGTETWDNARASMRLFFLDAANNTVAGGENVLDVSSYDKRAWAQYSMPNVVAPAGTEKVRVEFATYWGGTTMFDNAVLTAVPEPASLGVVAGAAAVLLGRGRRPRPAAK